MKAVITKQASNAVNHSGQKEVVSCWSVMGKINGELRTKALEALERAQLLEQAADHLDTRGN